MPDVLEQAHQIACDAAAHLSDWLAVSPPRLSRALFEAEAGKAEVFQTAVEKDVAAGKRAPIDLAKPDTFDADLEDLLAHVEERLKIGLTEAWCSRAAYNFHEADLTRDVKPTGSFLGVPSHQTLYCEPEEKWARALTEVLSFLSYGGPDIQYGLETQDLYTSPPRFYPLVLGCQHQVTYGVLSRGATVADVTMPKLAPGLACSGGCATDAPVFQPKGRKFKRIAELDTTSQFLPLVGPGDAVIFNFGGPDTGGQPVGGSVHIGSVLRVWGTRHLQYFDVGGLVDPSLGNDGGTTDHEWAPERLQSYPSTVGLGIQKGPPPDLEANADAFLKARPLGMARLVVFDEHPRMLPTVDKEGKPAQYQRALRARYVSPALHLWLDGRGVHVSQLMWSIRNPPTPKTGGIRLAWIVLFPQGPEKTSWVPAFLDDAVVGKRPETLWSPGNVLTPCNVAFGLPGGGLNIFYRCWRKDKDEKTGKEIDVTGWSVDYGAAAPSDNKPPSLPEKTNFWLAIRRAGDKRPADKVDGEELWQWQQSHDSFSKAYVLKPGDDEGHESTEKVGVAFFDQGR